MIWFTEEATEQWHPVKAGIRGRPLVYAAHAIETVILVGQVFHLPLRQTEGFMNSIARIMGDGAYDGESVSNAVVGPSSPMPK